MIMQLFTFTSSLFIIYTFQLRFLNYLKNFKLYYKFVNALNVNKSCSKS